MNADAWSDSVNRRRGPPKPFACVRARYPDCLCARCDPLLAAEAEAAWAMQAEADEFAAMLVGGAIDSVLSLVPVRVERRRWAMRALVVIRAKGIEPIIEAGALRVPMEKLPRPLVEWLADPVNRAAVEELLDEEQGQQRQEAA